MRNLTLIATILIGVAYATETRIQVLTQNALRDGYANFLLDDEYIIQFYPSALFKFPAHFTIEVPNIPRNTVYGNYDYASAFGKYQNYGFGAYLGRDRVGIDLDLNGNVDFTVVPIDLVGAINLTSASFGLNLRFGNASIDNKQDPATVNSATVIGLNPSLTFNIAENSAFNLGIPLQFVNGSSKTGNTKNFDYKDNRFGFFGRFYNSKFIAYALYLNRSQSSDNPATNANPDIKITTNTFSAGGGLNLPISDIGFGIIGLTANVESQNRTVGNQETKTSDFFLGFLIGGEVKALRDNFKLRSSFTYDFLRNVDANVKATGIGSVGDLTLGFGYEIGFIRFDASVSTELIYNGPYFLTGVPSGFIPSISILGKF
ncbi:MAG: hypothetical protein ABIL45_08540 [candidate division WOR-3 bacterium]